MLLFRARGRQAVFLLDDRFGVWHLPAENAAIGQAAGTLHPEEILELDLSIDMVNWLEALAAGSLYA
jgi:hypothetical protein